MLPTEFMARATWNDVGLLEAYLDARAHKRRKVREEAELMAGADRNADDAQRSL